MKRSWVGALALVGLVTMSFPAFAHGDKGAAFPMKAEVFQQKIEKKIAFAKTRFEEKVKSLSAEAQKAKRAHFEARMTALQEAAKKATADGVVTQEEAREVRRAAGKFGHKRPHQGDAGAERKG